MFLKLSSWSCLTGVLLSAWQDLHSFFAPLSSIRQLQLLERCLLISNTLFHLPARAQQLFSFYKPDILFALSFLLVSLLVSLPAGDNRHFPLSAAHFLFNKLLNLPEFPPFYGISRELLPPVTAADDGKSKHINPYFLTFLSQEGSDRPNTFPKLCREAAAWEEQQMLEMGFYPHSVLAKEAGQRIPHDLLQRNFKATAQR